MEEIPWLTDLTQSDKGSAVQKIDFQRAIIRNKRIFADLCHALHLCVAGAIQYQIDLLRVAALGIKLGGIRKAMLHFQIQHDEIAFTYPVQQFIRRDVAAACHQRRRVCAERLCLEQHLQVVIVLRQTEQFDLRFRCRQ